MTYPVREGPVVETRPLIVYKGQSWKLRTVVRDGVRTAALPYGDLVDVSAAAVSGYLRIDKPDGTTDVTRSTATAGEGAKADDDGDGTNDAFEFYVATTVTTGWSVGLHEGEVRYKDSSTTPTDDVPIYLFRVEVRPLPADL